MNIQAVTLLRNLNAKPNQISPSTYDTAWAGWLYSSPLDWVLDNQNPDGSWGSSSLEYYHDRVVATLSAINAIAATSTNGHQLQRIEWGINYLEQAIPLLNNDVFETISFELILPALVRTGQILGLKYGKISGLIQTQIPLFEEKLRLIPEQLIYSSEVILPHSIEFVGQDRLDHEAIERVRSKNGSIHHSPAATAFVEVANPTKAGRVYLENLLVEFGGVMPSMYPFEMFEIVWALHHLSLGFNLVEFEGAIPAIDALAAAWGKHGVGLSANFITDPDDTSLGYILLDNFGWQPDPSVMMFFEEADHFRCYPFERNHSFDVHVHIAEALHHVCEQSFPRKQEMLNKALRFINTQINTCYLVDKWHVSPYYSTSHAIITLNTIGKNVEQQVSWILSTQLPNGSWTFYPECVGAAIEESAYAILALSSLDSPDPHIRKAIEQGVTYLETNYQGDVRSLPALWINKNLYNPYYIVEAAILAALAAGKSRLQR